ncbi:PHP domain-containing protein [Halosimplex halobium]|uniref:PHP domain-containing protein n=1 Tax=Halosimplex halobium TaxID=3396618 RepID=UPI003F570D7C
MSTDLHIHTTASDGTATLDERIQQAQELNLQYIAITDHDRISSELSKPVANLNDVTVITGVEVRADLFGKKKIELLGYLINSSSSRLQEVLSKYICFRRERNEELVKELNAETGLELSIDELRSETAGGVGRPHFAEILKREGIVESIGAAFKEYLAESGRCYVPMERVEYTEVIESIHAAGGVVSLAHPGRIRSDRVKSMVETLADAGLDGIEVWYPYDAVRSDVGPDKASSLATKYSLIQTGGSDCHGPGSGKFRLGNVGAPIESVERLFAASAVEMT